MAFHSGEVFTYAPDPADWGHVVTGVQTFLATGDKRDDGSLERDWDDDLTGTHCELRDHNGLYTLTFWPQFTDPAETSSRIGFTTDGIDRLFGPIANGVHNSAEEHIEAAEMTLRLYLTTVL